MLIMVQNEKPKLVPPPVPPRPDKLNRKKNKNSFVAVQNVRQVTAPSNETTTVTTASVTPAAAATTTTPTLVPVPIVDDNKHLQNHEYLISELQKKNNEQHSNCTINHSRWYEVGDNGNEIQLSRCQIIIDSDENTDRNRLLPPLNLSASTPNLSTKRELVLLNGLPPLPKCLSDFNYEESRKLTKKSNQRSCNSSTSLSSISSQISSASNMSCSSPSSPTSSSASCTTTSSTSTFNQEPMNLLNQKFAYLKQEMNCLRQLDLSLLSQLCTLNESIQDFRMLLMDQDQDILSNKMSTSDFETDDIYHI